MTKPGAIPVLIALILGIWFAIPNEASLGYMIVNAFANGLCPDPNNVVCDWIPIYKILFNILGIAIIIGDLIYRRSFEGNI